MSEVYRRCSHEFIALVRTLDDRGLAVPVPACPGWTVHDLLAHLAGSSTDFVESNTSGAATPEWTRRQVADRAGWSAAQLIAEWLPNVEVVAAQCNRPTPNPAWDLAVHLDDLREALQVRTPLDRDREEVLAAALSFWPRGCGEAVSVSVAEIESDGGSTRWHLATTYGLWRSLFSRLEDDALSREVLRGDPVAFARSAYFSLG